MTMSDDDFSIEVSRRKLLAAAGLAGVWVASPRADAAAAPAVAAASTSRLDPVATPPVAGLHLQFGADAATQVTVSWHTLQPVHGARVILGRLDGRFEQTVAASTVSYTDAKAGQIVYAHHAKFARLKADTAYLYGALHDGAEPDFGALRTAPHGRARFTFTSFGDQGTPTLGKRFVPPAGVTLANPPFVNDNLGAPAAGDTTLGVERLRPLFHLFNGDLCYANLAQDRVRTWWDFWANNTRSARHRPWMPSPGNHENELGNGPIGYQAYQTYFSVPEASGQTDVTRGLWYAFTAGSVRVISIANDDVCYQHGGDTYVRGYSHGAQKTWLENELATARTRRDVDWVVVCMHQVAISTADKFNGADLGIREEWVPLFDRHGVDLVVCGHEHHYERSHPIRRARGQRHADADPDGDRHRRDRHAPRHRAHGDRRRRHVGAVEPAVLRPAAVPRDHRGRHARSDDGQAAADLRDRARTVVGRAQRGARLRLRRVRGGSRASVRAT